MVVLFVDPKRVAIAMMSVAELIMVIMIAVLESMKIGAKELL